MATATARQPQTAEMKYREAREIVERECGLLLYRVEKADTGLYVLMCGDAAISGAADTIDEAWIDAAMRIEERKGIQQF
jgi:hypothetical protein